MKEKINWKKEKTKALIELKHSLQYFTLFEESNNPLKQPQKTWQQRANFFVSEYFISLRSNIMVRGREKIQYRVF